MSEIEWGFAWVLGLGVGNSAGLAGKNPEKWAKNGPRKSVFEGAR